MAIGFYAVIVGTQPGIYMDWTETAPTVTEISGSIYKKYKTYPDALEAFNNAERNGKVRAVQLGPGSVAGSPPGSQIREHPPHGYPFVRTTCHSATRPRHRVRRSSATRSSMGAAGMMPSMYASQSDLAERTGHGTISTELGEYQTFGQQSQTADVGVQALLPTGSSSRGHGTGSWQESQHSSMRALPILSRADRGIAVARHEARSASASAEWERWILEGAGTALSQSPQPGPSTHRFFHVPQMGDDQRFPGDVTRHQSRPLSASPLADIRPDDIDSESSNGFSFNPPTPLINRPLYVEPSHTPGSQGPYVNPVVSPQVHSHGVSNRKGKRRASVQTPDTNIGDSFDWSEIRRSVPSPQIGMIEIGDSLSPPGSLLRSSSPCSHISVTSSNESMSAFSFEVNIPVVETSGTPGRSTHVASSPSPHPTASHLTVSSPVENAIPDPSTQSQEGLNEEDGDNSQDLQATSSARFRNLGDVVDTLEHTEVPQAELSVLFEGSPTLIRLQSPSKVASTSRTSTHLQTQSIRPSGLDTTPQSRVWPLWSPSLPPNVDQEASRSTEVTGLGLSIEGIMSPSPHSHPLQHHTTTQIPPRSPSHRPLGSNEGQGSAGHDTPLWDAPAPAPQAQESPSYLRSAISNLMHLSRGVRSTNNTAPSNSPHDIPLPSSPTASTSSGSSTQSRSRALQAQPSHRSSPHMSFYPSLAVDREDTQERRQQQQRTLLSPSGRDVPLGFAFGFGRPTPHPSPAQASAGPAPEQEPPPPPVVIRAPSPSADPRSPISRLTRIPSNIMGLFFGRTTGTPPRGTARMDE